MNGFFFLPAVIICAVYGQLVLKARATIQGNHVAGSGLSYLASMLTDPWVWTAVFAFALAALFWLMTLRSVALSVAYPIVSVVFVLVPLAAAFLGEPIIPLRVVGNVVVILGVILTVMAS